MAPLIPLITILTAHKPYLAVANNAKRLRQKINFAPAFQYRQKETSIPLFLTNL